MVNSEAEEYKEDARRIARDYVDPDSTTRGEIQRDLENADFGNPDEVAEWMLSAEDVGIDADTAHRGGITTREDVERAVAEADTVDYGAEREEAVTDSVSREVGAPSRDALDRAEIRMLSQETVTPEGTTTPVSVIRDQRGDAVAVIGGGSAKAGQSVADEVGGTYYSGIKDYTASLSARPAPDGRRALLYSDDSAVGEVDL